MKRLTPTASAGSMRTTPGAAWASILSRIPATATVPSSDWSKRGAGLRVHSEGFRAEYAKPVAFFLATSDSWDDHFTQGYIRVLRKLASGCGAEIIDTRRRGAIRAWLENHPGQLDPDAVRRLLPGVQVGPVRIRPRHHALDLIGTGIERLIKGIGILLYGIFMTVSISVQLIWWGFLLYVIFAAVTGLDPLGIGSHLGPDISDPTHPQQDSPTMTPGQLR